ncbi:hypothetical protein GPECTOR_26g564 [Gonium pectorale]|uniref:RING-type domain-containing protein n=1 Tax=Gonium pectorale TaxID=33097 RepID=A0A150GFP4_GONPE|nr:hypothetical protein GPECTOR_26g564 [Gonium pectorale]|eukprot:KXZ48661.1 hypothetical protein GPECTOR_26g564 [Gonium pectorale]
MADVQTAPELCLRCHKEPIAYLTLPCRHKTLCAGCAARVATGGKCCLCHKFFQKLKHLPKPGEEPEDDEETEEEEDEAADQEDDDEDDAGADGAAKPPQ